MSNNFMGVQNGDPKESWATPTLDRYFGNPTPQTLPLDAPVKVSALNQTNVRRVVVSGARIAYQTPPSTALCDTQSESSNESSPGSQKGTYVAGLSDALDKMVTGPSPDSERY
ncbi:hypothetical protein HOH87_01780 [bacterium]|nr:hypothetical protein [bacterium]